MKGTKTNRGQVKLIVSAVWLVLIVLAALLADVLPLKPYDTLVRDLPPRLAAFKSWSEPFGIDAVGRSMISRLLYGARVSLLIGLLSTVGAMVVGTSIGLAAGYFRGKIEWLLNLLIDALLSIPTLVLLLTVAAIGRRGVPTMIVSLSLVGAPTFARLARANTIRVRNRAFITAARAMGARPRRIIFREVLPSVLLSLLSYAFLFTGAIIVVEGTLSFLGLGIQPPAPSWGGMINDGRRYMQIAPHVVFVPAAFIVLTVVSVSTIGDRVRRLFDSRGSAL